jgi:cap1 methyltransferase
LDKFNPESPHDNFELCYGRDDTGDITKNENLKDLSENIDRGTEGRGVALLMADGVCFHLKILINRLGFLRYRK